MNGICIKTPWLHRQSIFPPRVSASSLNHAVVTLWLYTPPSHPHTLLPPWLSSSVSLLTSISLPSSGAPRSPLHLCRGVSEWWSFSGPCERSCGFPVPHIRGRALALCMLQEFGLARHQAPNYLLSLARHRRRRQEQGPDKLPEHALAMYTKLRPRRRCLYLYSLTFIRTYVCFYYIHFLSAPRRGMS